MIWASCWSGLYLAHQRKGTFPKSKAWPAMMLGDAAPPATIQLWQEKGRLVPAYQVQYLNTMKSRCGGVPTIWPISPLKQMNKDKSPTLSSLCRGAWSVFPTLWPTECNRPCLPPPIPGQRHKRTQQTITKRNFLTKDTAVLYGPVTQLFSWWSHDSGVQVWLCYEAVRLQGPKSLKP